MTRQRRPVAFAIDQALVDAPAFPRPVEWWTRFLPMWVNVVEQRPDGGIYLAVAGRQGPALERFLAETARGRLAGAVTPAEPPAEVPQSRWDVWLAAWRAERSQQT